MRLLAFVALAAVVSCGAVPPPVQAAPTVITVDALLVEGEMEVHEGRPNTAKFGPGPGPEVTVKEWVPSKKVSVARGQCVVEFFAGLNDLTGKSIGKTTEAQYCNGGSLKLVSATWENLTFTSFSTEAGSAKICDGKWGQPAFPKMVPYTLHISRTVTPARGRPTSDYFRGAQPSSVRLTVSCLKE